MRTLAPASSPTCYSQLLSALQETHIHGGRGPASTYSLVPSSHAADSCPLAIFRCPALRSRGAHTSGMTCPEEDKLKEEACMGWEQAGNLLG